MKTKPCDRCNSKGCGDWHPQGGLCWKCQGAGQVHAFTMAERVAKYVERCETALADLQRRGEELKAEIEALKGRGRITISLDGQLAVMRDQYRDLRSQMVAAKSSGRVTTQQQPAAEPAWETSDV